MWPPIWLTSDKSEKSSSPLVWTRYVMNPCCKVERIWVIEKFHVCEKWNRILSQERGYYVRTLGKLGNNVSPYFDILVPEVCQKCGDVNELNVLSWHNLFLLSSWYLYIFTGYWKFVILQSARFFAHWMIWRKALILDHMLKSWVLTSGSQKVLV